MTHLHLGGCEREEVFELKLGVVVADISTTHKLSVVTVFVGV